MQTQPQLKGVVAQLITRDLYGCRIDSKLVFQPSQNWYIMGDHDYLGEIEYTDPEAFLNEFGEETLKKVIHGKIVTVETKPTSDLSFSGGPVRNFKKSQNKIIYPIPGTREILVLE